MALKLLDWHSDKTIPYRSDIQDEYDSIEFFEDGDDFLVYLNEDNGKYAVYYKLAHGGIVCSLIEHFDMYSRLVDTNDGLSKELYEVIARHAIGCGFPETHPPINVGVTWRQLIAKLGELPQEFLDTPAYVWRPDGGGTLAAVYGIDPWCRCYDGTVPGPGGEDDNVYYINNGFPDEE